MIDEGRYHMIDAVGRDITLTPPQRKCIDYDSKTALVIKGTAGSGKTFMVIKRAMDYRERILKEGREKKVVIFTYNSSLAEVIRFILQKNDIPLDTPVLSVSTADSYITNLCKKFNLIPKMDSLYYDRRVERNINYRRSGSKGYDQQMFRPIELDDERIAIVSEVLSKLSKVKDHPYYHRDPQVWADEILWMYRNGIVDGDDEERYMNIPRDGRCKNYTVHLSKNGRKVVIGIFNEYNVYLMNKRRFEWERIYALLYRDHLGEVDGDSKIDYVLIDEAQDMSLVKMSILKYLCRSELNVAMDRNQSIYGHRWQFKRDLGLISHVKKLEVMHRGTKEIDDFSSDLKRIDDTLIDEEDRYENETSTKESGCLPEIVRCSSQDSELDFLVNELRPLLDSNANVGILCPDHRHLDLIQNKLIRNGIPCTHFRDDGFKAMEPGVKLITIHSSKGLGFVYVFIPYFEHGVFPKSVESMVRSIQRTSYNDSLNMDEAMAEEISASRRLLYVGITRALLKVTLMYSGEPSEFIRDFDRAHYMLVDEAHRPLDIDMPQSETKVRPILRGPISAEPPTEHVVEVEEPPSPTESIQDQDSLISLLESIGVEYVDKRPKGGCLWVIMGPNSDKAVFELRRRGYNPIYSENNRSVNRKPAYFVR